MISYIRHLIIITVPCLYKLEISHCRERETREGHSEDSGTDTGEEQLNLCCNRPVVIAPSELVCTTYKCNNRRST